MTTTPTIQDRIKAATDEAHAICKEHGDKSKQCAAAWDIVEELNAEAGHQAAAPQKSNFEKYCDDNPDAAECLIYDD